MTQNIGIWSDLSHLRVVFLWAQLIGAESYFWKTKKRPFKTKPRTKPLPKAKEKD